MGLGALFLWFNLNLHETYILWGSGISVHDGSALSEVIETFPHSCAGVLIETSFIPWISLVTHNEAEPSKIFCVPPSKSSGRGFFMDFIPQQGPATEPGQASLPSTQDQELGHPRHLIVPDSCPPKFIDIETKQVTSLNPCVLEHTALKRGGNFLFLPQGTGWKRHCSTMKISNPISSSSPSPFHASEATAENRQLLQ